MADNGVFGTGLVLDWELISSAQNSYDFLTQEVVLKSPETARLCVICRARAERGTIYVHVRDSTR